MGKSSPLMQGRGLKPKDLRCFRCFIGSPLMQGRGLKLHKKYYPRLVSGVAPHAGAWIETFAAEEEE